ncbi:EamA family transporter [Collinsella sp. AF28-5AC]|uniref:EamA family transporter n=1 Tax=Collinsella sp. AF28-5AC TaxID=2292227 RepID=UPI003515390A
MIEKKQSAEPEQQQDRTWLAYALGAAVFAALTSVLAKIGIEGVESNLATAIRTCVVLVMAWAIVAAKGKLEQFAHVDRRELTFLATSGIATGASWLLYYYAIAAGQVSVVVQIDKLSIVVSVLFARLAFNEKLSRRSAIGLVLIVLGTAALAIWK